MTEFDTVNAKLEKMDDKLDVLANNQTKIMTVLFDTEGNQGITSKVASVCKVVDRHKTSLTKIWIILGIIGIIVGALSGFNVEKIVALANAG